MEALQRLHNRGSISTGFNIDYSLKFETDNTEYLMAEGRPQGTQTTWTWSCWLKRTEVNNGVIAQYIFSAGSDGKTGIYFRDDSSSTGGDTIFIYVDEGNSLKYIGELAVSFRDTSAWYHIVFAVDSTNSTAADRTKIYVNGVQQTITYSATLNQNVSTRVGDGGGKFSIGGKVANTGYGFNGYMAECVLVDGSALTPTSFGEFDEDSNIWKPKDVSSLSLGTAGFHMNFDDSSNVGAVKTGTSQGNFDKYNLSAADQATDTPTNNFATLNPLNRNSGSSGVTNNSVFTEGNTKITGNLNAYWQSGVANIGITSGKWYFEATPYDSNTKICTIGYGDEADIENWGKNNDFPGAAGSKSYGYAGGTAAGYGQIIPSTNLPNPAVTYNQTNIIGVAIDADNGYVYWSKDGTYINSGNPTSGASGTGGIAIPTGAGTNGTLLPAVGFYYDGTVPIMLVNFGGYTTISISSPASDSNNYGTFEYAPPSGYYALCTKNLEEYG